MTQYLVSVFHPADYAPPAEEMRQIVTDVDALNVEMRETGVWVFAGGLHPPSTATVLRVRDGEVLVTDGPFAEAKEQVGGFWVIEAPDLDAALDWGRRATRACRIPVEVRPFQSGPPQD